MKTKKITLNEVQALVKQIITENNDEDESLFSEDTVLNGMSNEKARNTVKKIAEKAYHTGIYRDEFWEGPHKIKEAFGHANIDFNLISAEYYNCPDIQIPCGKKWTLYFPFINKKGKKTVLQGVIHAAGAGSVEDPLDAYDINFIVY